MTRVIPKEQLTAYERWEVAAFDEAEQDRKDLAAAAAVELTPGPADTPIEAEEPVVVLPTAEEIERMHIEAHEQGYAAGYAEGIAQARAASEQMDLLMLSLQEAIADVHQTVAEQLLATAVEVAQQMVRQSLRIHPELILPVVKEAILALHPNFDRPLLFTHPDDALLIREQLGDTLTHKHWQIIEDATLSAGGCRIELGASEVDATLETRWRRILESIGISPEWLVDKP